MYEDKYPCSAYSGYVRVPYKVLYSSARVSVRHTDEFLPYEVRIDEQLRAAFAVAADAIAYAHSKDDRRD